MMNPTCSPFSHREYCSQQGDSVPSFHTLEGNVKLIKGILQKKTLCYHDVMHINKAYQTMDQLESQCADSSYQHSSALLLKLTKRVEAAKDLNQISAEEIITAYHLKHLKISSLNATDVSFTAPIHVTLEKLKAIATHLPFCKSGEQFEVDVEALLGKNYSADITALLQAKKDRFCEYQERWAALKQLRAQNPSLYPSYLEEILQGGFFHLYDHLIHMKALETKAERTAAIERLSFASFAKVILEFRKATLSRVEKMIPKENPNTIFLLGNTGSGKSTTLCYLRGDQMVLKNGAYQSSTDKGHLIGNNTEMSCTLFPNISVKDNLALVDFPGFADTHGEVISLAIELTLRTLTKKYSPKIVLLAPITDTEPKFEHIHLLGRRLERVLGTLDSCILGLTKYSNDVDFIHIKNIEEQQRQELFSPGEEEKKLEQQIKALEPFAEAVPAIKAQLDQHKENLQHLQALKPSSSHYTLPDTEEKSKHYANLLLKEEAFKKHSGIQTLLSLKDLNDPAPLKEMIQTLSNQEKSVPILMSNELDASQEKLLETLFITNLVHVITAQKNHSSLSLDSSLIATSKVELSQKIEAFGQSILETSLINTLLERSYPEIGEFLHLESMDPAIVRKYDKEVITGCISGYIDDIISGLLVAEKLIEKFKKTYSLQDSQKMDHEWAALRSSILTLSKGTPPNADPDKIQEAWESIQKEYNERLDRSKKELTPPTWLKAILLIPLGIPFGIFYLFKKFEQNKTLQTFTEGRAKNLYQSIKAAGEALINLKDIENAVKKKDQFDEIFTSHPLSLTSIDSLRESIEKQITLATSIYGKDDWGKRITLITNQLTSLFASIRTSSLLGENILYSLISQETSYKDLPPYFNEHTFLALIYSFLNSPLGSDFIKSKGNYKKIIARLIPCWEFTTYNNLNLSAPSYFFHISSLTEQEYLLLKEQRQKLLELCNKNPILRLIFADALFRLWKALPERVNENKKFGFFTTPIYNDQAKILDAIQENASILEYSKEDLRDDKDFILEAVTINGQALAFTHHSLKNDKAVVFTAVKQNREALQYASQALKNDRTFLLEIAQQNGDVLQFASDALKNDQEFLLAAFEQNANALQFASNALKNDRNFILAAVQQNGNALQFAGDALKSDRQFLLAAVQQNGYALQFTSDALKNDREFLLAAVQQNEDALQFASDALKNDRQFLLTAIQQNGSALKYASDALKNNREFLLAAIQQNGNALQSAGETLKNNREFTLAAIQQNKDALKHISETLKNDRKFILMTIQQNSWAFKYTHEKFKNDREFILAALQQNGYALKYTNEACKNDKELVLIAVRQNGDAFQYASETLKNSQEFMIAALKQSEHVLKFASDTLKNSREFILIALQQHRDILKHASEILKNDKELVLAAIQQDGRALQYASEALKNDKELVLIAIKRDRCALQYASNALKNDKEFILTALQYHVHVLQYASEALKNDKEFILTALQYHAHALQYASQTLKNDREFILAAFQKDEWALQHASETLKNDKEFILAAVQKRGHALQYASEILKNNREFILDALKHNEYALQFASDALKNDQELVLFTVQKNGWALQFASEMLKNDQKIVLTAVKQSGYALNYASEALKNDKDFILTAIQYNKDAFQYASETLKNDQEFVQALNNFF
ncbi:MAG: DUF4116 domain-containing protein [Candidatus Rhabdochlamydia sp.]